MKNITKIRKSKSGGTLYFGGLTAFRDKKGSWRICDGENITYVPNGSHTEHFFDNLSNKK